MLTLLSTTLVIHFVLVLPDEREVRSENISGFPLMTLISILLLEAKDLCFMYGGR